MLERRKSRAIRNSDKIEGVRLHPPCEDGREPEIKTKSGMNN
jgi:hypothetical protein